MDPRMLWRQYDEAVRRGDMDTAQRILSMIQSYKGHPQSPGGCSSCSRKFYYG